MPLLTGAQVSPLFVDRKTPENVPAKMSPAELVARARISVAVNPLLIRVQVSPLSEERNTPPPSVPAKTSPFAVVTCESTSPPSGPFVAAQKSLPVIWKAPLGAGFVFFT